MSSLQVTPGKVFKLLPAGSIGPADSIVPFGEFGVDYLFLFVVQVEQKLVVEHFFVELAFYAFFLLLEVGDPVHALCFNKVL